MSAARILVEGGGAPFNLRRGEEYLYLKMSVAHKLVVGGGASLPVEGAKSTFN